MTNSAPATPARASRPEAGSGEPRFGGRFAFTGSLRVRAARGTLINTAFTVALGLLGLLQAFILARFLSRSDYGLWGIVAISVTTFLWLKQAGIGDKFVQQDEADQELAFQRAFTLDVLATVACVILLAGALPLLVLIYRLPGMVLPCGVLAAVLLSSTVQAPLWVYYRRMEFGRWRLISAIEPVVCFAVSVTLAATGAGYWAFVGGIAAGSLALSVTAAATSPYRLRWRFQPAALRAYWAFSGPLLAAGAATFVMAWAAVISAKLAIGIAAVGVVTLAESISSFTNSVDSLVSGSLYPAICAVKDRLELMYESLVKSNRLALMWAVPFGLGLTLFAPELVRFGIGERWQAAIPVLQVFGATAAVNHVGFNWDSYFRALGRTRPIAAVNGLATAVFVIAGIPLIVLLGLRGFAIGIALQALAAVALRSYYLRLIFPGFDFLKHAARAFLPTVPGVLAVLLVRALAPAKHGLGLALVELASYLLITALATWRFESGLLREAASHVLGRGTVAAV